MFRQAGTEFYR